MATNGSPPEHNWEHRGINPPFPHKNGTFWGTWIKQILAFVLGALTAAYAVGGKSEVINGLVLRVAKIEATQERMDTQGTNRSHWKNDELERKILENHTAIMELKKTTEPVNVMQFKIENLEKRIIGQDAIKR